VTVSQPLPVEIINQTARMDVAVKEMLDSSCIALDTESDSFYHYPEQLCLIQVATSHRVYLIATIVMKEIPAFKEVLSASVTKVIHGADYDIRSLDRQCGFRIRSLYDTSIAARFAGLTQVGLAALLENLLGVTIPKSKRLQRADWGRRPLSAELLEYAASDVRHLVALADVLAQRLQALGRTEWVDEECARLEEVRFTAPDPETAYLSVKGARDLDGRGLAILRSLFLFRDEESRREHRPPFFVIPDPALLYLAAKPAADFSEVPGLGQTALHRFGRGLRQALHDGMAAAPVVRPARVLNEIMSQEQFRRLGRLKAWRISLGAALSLDPSLLWPMASLERLARVPQTFNAELSSPDIRHWQRAQFSGPLRAFLESLG
jgi:ribonuclease D